MLSPSVEQSERLDRHVSEDILCPRCGYDLRGAIVSWREVCPMNGVCAECGLDFEWSWMFHHRLHPWLFEHQWKRLHAYSAVRTVLVSCLPARLCREITLMHPVRLRPLIGLLVAMLLFILPLRAAALGYVMLYGDASWGTRLDYSGFGEITTWEYGDFAIYIASVLVVSPLVFLAIPASLQRIRVRPAHIARLWLYQLIGVVCVVLIVSILQSTRYFIVGRDTFLWMRPGDWRFLPDSPDTHWARWVLFDTVRPVWVIAVFWIWHWWRVACRDYLRLPDATLTATLLTIIVALASYLVQHGVSVWRELV